MPTLLATFGTTDVCQSFFITVVELGTVNGIGISKRTVTRM
jgi:hypothetical protein